MHSKNRKQNRLHGYNYAQPGWYYITICTKDRKHYFGGIQNGVMCVNRLGAIAWRQWKWLEQQYTYVRLHEFVVMPNHVHGILQVVDLQKQRSVGTGRDLSLHARGNDKIKSLSELIGAYKTTTSKLIHQIPFADFAWQRSFHDHIIRKTHAFHNIKRYIIQNPAMWDNDYFNT
ncbi:MAG: hypothetical protein CO029_05030 [Candidatus Magasanikbacteria bacterium CG_4_9_14_0_2_um_filter_41_10]|nr:MAG: hypothetical protein COU34_00940 [Candidatus Magasanikbacteria bacterium CG10_big_fil_rev_8_21_14_0_10_43_9]PJC52997.1 MAG: hypothetical protein CO029_05030 [Candidatus Magasanikbacteria bacterium CG_4_9_14_0_2_um_filter_41_10]